MKYLKLFESNNYINWKEIIDDPNVDWIYITSEKFIENRYYCTAHDQYNYNEYIDINLWEEGKYLNSNIFVIPYGDITIIFKNNDCLSVINLYNTSGFQNRCNIFNDIVIISNSGNDIILYDTQNFKYKKISK